MLFYIGFVGVETNLFSLLVTSAASLLHKEVLLRSQWLSFMIVFSFLLSKLVGTESRLLRSNLWTNISVNNVHWFLSFWDSPRSHIPFQFLTGHITGDPPLHCNPSALSLFTSLSSCTLKDRLGKLKPLLSLYTLWLPDSSRYSTVLVPLLYPLILVHSTETTPVIATFL